MTESSEMSSAQPELVPTPKRPGWPKVVGILSIVFGGLTLVCGGFGLAVSFVMPNFMSSMMGGQFQDVPPPPMTPPVTPLIIGTALVGLLMNVVLVVAGVATLRRKPKGRTLHLVYAVVQAIVTVPSAWAQHNAQQTQMANMEAWVEQYGDTDEGRPIAQSMAQQKQVQQATAMIGPIIGVALGLAWPVFCIVWFGMIKRDAEAMGGGLPEEEGLY